MIDNFDLPCDVPYWFGLGVPGVDCQSWLPFMTGAELGLDRPKWTIDVVTGREYVSFPAGWTDDGVVADTVEAA